MPLKGLSAYHLSGNIDSLVSFTICLIPQVFSPPRFLSVFFCCCCVFFSLTLQRQNERRTILHAITTASIWLVRTPLYMQDQMPTLTHSLTHKSKHKSTISLTPSHKQTDTHTPPYNVYIKSHALTLTALTTTKKCKMQGNTCIVQSFIPAQWSVHFTTCGCCIRSMQVQKNLYSG